MVAKGDRNASICAVTARGRETDTAHTIRRYQKDCHEVDTGYLRAVVRRKFVSPVIDDYGAFSPEGVGCTQHITPPFGEDAAYVQIQAAMGRHRAMFNPFIEELLAELDDNDGEDWE